MNKNGNGKVTIAEIKKDISYLIKKVDSMDKTLNDIHIKTIAQEQRVLENETKIDKIERKVDGLITKAMTIAGVFGSAVAGLISFLLNK